MIDYLRQKIPGYQLPYRAHRPQAVLRACQEACGPRTPDKATHTRPDHLRPWEGPVRIVSLAEQGRADRRLKETVYRVLYGGVTTCL